MKFTKQFVHKYGAIKTEVNGIKFPSKLEANCYSVLKLLEKEKKVRMFLRQVPFDIGGGAKHVVDFCVFTPKHVLFIEAKGRDLSHGKLKRRQVEELYGVEIHVATKPEQIRIIVEQN